MKKTRKQGWRESGFIGRTRKALAKWDERVRDAVTLRGSTITTEKNRVFEGKESMKINNKSEKRSFSRKKYRTFRKAKNKTGIMKMQGR